MTGDRRFAAYAVSGTFLVGVLIGVVATLANLTSFSTMDYLVAVGSGPAPLLARTVVGVAGLFFATVFVALTTYAVVRKEASVVSRVAHVVAGVGILVPLGFGLLLAGVVSIADPLDLVVGGAVPLLVGVVAGVAGRHRESIQRSIDPVPWTTGLNVVLAVALFSGLVVGSIAVDGVRESLVVSERGYSLVIVLVTGH